MRNVISLTTPLDKEAVCSLKAGDQVLLNGPIYTARDKAHQRMVSLHENGHAIPVDLNQQVIYYAGPTPAKPESVIGSVGPTTASRMDGQTPYLLRHTGVIGLIGKGPRNNDVMNALRDVGAVYFVAIGGTGAQISQAVTKAQVVAFEDLGTEAIRRLEVKNFPLIVACDAHGGNLFESGPAAYRE